MIKKIFSIKKLSSINQTISKHGFSSVYRPLVVTAIFFVLTFINHAVPVSAINCNIFNASVSPNSGVIGDTVTISFNPAGCEYNDIDISSGAGGYTATNVGGLYDVTLSGPPENYTIHSYASCTDAFDRNSCAEHKIVNLRVNANVPPPATLNVSVVDQLNNPLSGASWSIFGGTSSPTPSSGSGTSVSHTVYPTAGGTSITVGNISPASITVGSNVYNFSGVTNSDGGGSTLVMYPSNTKSAVIHYTKGDDPDCAVSLTATPSTINSGESATLTWTSANMNSSSGVNFNTGGAQSNSFGVSVSPTVTTTYIINGTGGNGCSDYKTVTVNSVVTPPPVTLSGSTGSCGGNINLSWTTSSGATTYKIYRDGSLINSVSGTSYTDTVSVGTSHTYKVIASNGTTDSTDSNTVNVTGSSACVTGPGTPTGLNAIPGACGTGKIDISWNPSSGATSYGLKDNGIQVYSGPATSFSQTGLTAGSSHSYVVYASNGVTLSPESSPAFGPVIAPAASCGGLPSPTPFTATPGACGTASITLNWGSSAGATGYRLSRNSSVIQFTTGFSFNDTGLTPGQTYSYDVYSTNGSINSSTLNLSATAPNSCAGQPDLTAVITSAPTTAANTSTSLQAQITNGGTVTTGSSFNNVFRLATAANGGGSISFISVNSSVAIGAGSSGTVNSSSFTYPSNGTYSVSVCADNNASMVGTITEINEFNNCSGWVNVTVGGASVTATLSANPTTVPWAGGNTTLTWSSSGMVSCTASNTAGNGSWTGAKALSGSQSVFVNFPTTFQLDCVDSGGTTISPTVFVTTGNGPDLTVGIVSPLTATIGTPVAFSAQVNNVGNQDTIGSFNTYFQASTGPNGTGILFSGGVANTSLLAQGSSRIVTTTPSSPFGSQNGTYYIRACADDNGFGVGTVNETAEDNNCGAWSQIIVSAPDLTAGSPTPVTATAGTPLTFTSTISNVGGATTGSSFNNLFQVATAAGGGGTISTLSVNSLGALGASTSGPVTSSSYTFPSAGTYSVRTCADADAAFTSTINEGLNEGNNCSAWISVTVSSALPVPVVSISANPTSGTVNVVNPQLTWSATNNPSSCTASGDWSGAQATSGTGVSQGVLSVVKTYTYTLTCTNGTGASAPVSATVTVSAASGPDLTPTVDPAPTTATAGTPLTFSATIKNIGTASTGVSFNNFFRTSTGANGTGVVSTISVNSLGRLTANTSGVVTSSSYTFPSAGTNYVQVCADANASMVGTIAESNEANNCSNWVAVTVSAPLPVPVVTITANPTSGTVNVVNPQLSWSATNSASSCTASGDWSGAKATSGTSVSQGVLSVVRTYTYTLTCSNATGASAPVSATVTVSAAAVCVAAGSGSGLTGSYYDGISFNSLVTTRVDTSVNFDPADWLGISYANSADGDTFSTKWEGQVQPTCSENYTFYTRTDDGVRLYVNGSLVIDQWILQGPTEWSSASIPMTAGQKYDIRMEFYENGGGATAQLSWMSPTVAKQIIPTSQLYPLLPDLTAGAASPAAATAGSPIAFTATITNGGGAATGANFSNFFQVATAANGGGTVTDLTSASMTALAASGSNTATSPSYTFPSSGTYSVRACADKTSSAGGGVITESDETNNCGAWTSVTVAAAAAFNYTLSNSGDIAVTKTSGTVNVQNTITETLTAGTTQPVTISASGQPSGVSVSYSGNPCSPTCGTPTVQFAVSSSATTGTFLVTVTGTSAATADKTTTFNLTINPSVGFTGTSSVTPSSAFVGQQVTWTCSISGGVAPYTYVWTGTDFPTPSPTTSVVSITYQSVGVKTASAVVTDSVGNTTSCASKTVQVNINPNFKEF